MCSPGLSEYQVRTFADCLELLRLGEDNRATRETHMNMASSRSHSIFTLLVEQTRPNQPAGGEDRQLRSKFNLVRAMPPHTLSFRPRPLYFVFLARVAPGFW